MSIRTFMLTVGQCKQLIAQGLLVEPRVREAMFHHRLLIVAGTTNAYIAQEALKLIGDDTPFDADSFRRGITVAPGAEVPGHGTTFDLLIDHGKAYFDRTVFEIAPELGKDDMILKGANALHLPTREAAVLVGSSEGGTMIPIVTAAVGRRVQLIVPVGLEKRVDKPIPELVTLANASDCAGPRLFPIPGTPYTELDALRTLHPSSSFELIASGGIFGAEGALYLSQAELGCNC